jgi:hypothetical protein
MTLTSIYNKTKSNLIKGVKPIDLLIDIEATAWEYAFQCLKDKHITSISDYNDLFMNLYTQALKTLRKARVSK